MENKLKKLNSLLEEKINLDEYLKDRLPKSILQEAIQGKLVPQDPNDEPAAKLLERIREEKRELVKQGKLKKSELNDSVIFKGEDNKYYEQLGKEVSCIEEVLPFELPLGWEWCRLSVIAQMYTGNSINETEKKKYYTNVDGVEYIGTKDVGFNHSVEYNNGVRIPEQYISKFKIAPANSILMCVEGGSAGRKIAVVNKSICFGNKLCCFATSNPLISKYLYYFLQAPTFQETFSHNTTGIIGGVSVNTLKQMIIALPPEKEMERICQKVDDVLASIMRR